MIMRKKILYIVVFLQTAVLAWLVYDRESTLLGGTEVWLKTMPVDPRDYLRGDYVNLNYEISNPSEDLYSTELKALLKEQNKEEDYDSYKSRKNITVYVTLAVDPDIGLASVKSVDVKKPGKGELFIEGHMEGRHSWRSDIEYGIESYYVEEGTGLAIEQRARDNSRSLDVHVRINKKGRAVIEGLRWSGVEMLLSEDDSGTYVLTIENYDNYAVAIVLPKNLDTIGIERYGERLSKGPREPRSGNINRVDTPDVDAYKSEDVFVIPADNHITVPLNLKDLLREPITQEVWATITYQPPKESMLPSLPKEAKSWVGNLRTHGTFFPEVKPKTNAEQEENRTEGSDSHEDIPVLGE